MSAFIKLSLISSLLLCLTVLLPPLAFIIAIGWGALLIRGSLTLSQRQIGLIYLLNFSLLYGLAGTSTLLFYAAFFGLPALLMSLLINRHQAYYSIQKWGVAAAVLGVSLFLGLLYWNSGQIGMEQTELQINNYVQESLKAYEDSGFIGFYESRGLSRAELEKSFKVMTRSIVCHLPALYYVQAIMEVFFMLLLASFLSRKSPDERLKRKAYTEEMMPWPLVWVLIVGLALWLWGRDEMGSLYYAGSNIMVVMTPIAVYYGLAVLLFEFKRLLPSKRKLFATLLIILSLFFPLSAIIFLSLMGLFDSLLNFRKIALEREVEK